MTIRIDDEFNAIPLTIQGSNGKWFYIQDFKHHQSAFVMLMEFKPAEGASPHMCGYMNVERELWRKFPDDRALALDITFEGIEADWCSLPIRIVEALPMKLKNFWIGIDCMSSADKMPDDLVILKRLCLILRELLDLAAADSTV